jgi:general secretion pathway protein H
MANQAAMVTTKISATGNKALRAGFTLIELMVVLAIVGIMLTVTAAIMSGSHESYKLRQESERLHDTLRMAASDAVLRGREWGVVVTSDDYNFVYFDQEQKQWADADIVALERHALPVSLTLKLEATNYLTLPADTSTPPDILLLSSGQTSAFTLTLLVKDDQRQRSVLTADGRSDILLDENSHVKAP